MLFAILVRIEAAFQFHDSDFDILFQQKQDRAFSGLQSGRVGVEVQVEVLRNPFHRANLLHGKSGAAGGYHVGDTGLSRADHVHVAFHQNHAVQGHAGFLCAVQIVQNLGFFVNRGFRRVHVLRFVFGVHGAPPKGDNLAGLALDRKHEAVTEAVVQRAVIPAACQARLFHLLPIETALLQKAQQTTS